MDIFDNTTTLEEQMVHLATSRSIPIGGSIELLPLCNMSCNMCYVRLSKSEMEQQGKMRTLDEWRMLANQMKENGVLFLLLTGGEPLLYPDFKELYLYLQKIGMILTINTNGTLIDKKWAEFFGKNPPRRINVTLYGTNEETYSSLCHHPGGLKKTIEAIRLLREQKVDVKINGSLVKANCSDIDKITELARSLGVPIKIDTYMYPVTRERSNIFNEHIRLSPQDAADAKLHFTKNILTSEQFKKYTQKTLHLVKNTPVGQAIPRSVECRAGKSSFAINWCGEMRPCILLITPSISVFEHDFTYAWKYIVKETDKIRLSAKCNQCSFRKVCQTCAACAFWESGKYDGVPEYMCQYTSHKLDVLKQIDES